MLTGWKMMMYARLLWKLAGRAAVALGYVGVPYDYESLFANITGRVLADSRRFFCSEYVYWCGLEAGLPDWQPAVAPRPSDMPQLNWWSDPVEITPTPQKT